MLDCNTMMFELAESYVVKNGLHKFVDTMKEYKTENYLTFIKDSKKCKGLIFKFSEYKKMVQNLTLAELKPRFALNSFDSYVTYR